MPNDLPLYPYSAKEARERNELPAWRESFRENCACAGAIEISIREHFDGMHLKDGAAPFGRFDPFLLLIDGDLAKVSRLFIWACVFSACFWKVGVSPKKRTKVCGPICIKYRFLDERGAWRPKSGKINWKFTAGCGSFT